jgi:plastocyanin
METFVLIFTTRIRLLLVALLLATAATLLFVACGGTATTPTSGSPTAQAQLSPTPSLTPVAIVNVKIVEKEGKFAFDPASLTVKVGTQVVWTNDSIAPHTVTSDTLAFNTPNNLNEHQTFMVIFTKPGTYTYYCNIHTYMTGTITVTS